MECNEGNGMKKKYKNVTAPSYTPKFHAGQRVQISDEGVRYQIAKKGTTGTVTHCGLVVQVKIDGHPKEDTHSYWPDYWDSV